HIKGSSLIVLSTDHVHCDSGGAAEAFFGGGTKLTVLGKKSNSLKHRKQTKLLKCNSVLFVFKFKRCQNKAYCKHIYINLKTVETDSQLQSSYCIFFVKQFAVVGSKLQQQKSSCFQHCDSASEAYFGKGTKLTVLEQDHEVKSPTVKILPPSDNECRKKKRSKRKKTLVCVASGFYPDHVSVSWNIDGQSVTDGVATDSAAVKKDKFYTVTSRLTVPAEAWFNPQTVFNCTVNFFNGSSNNPYSDSISSNKKDKGIGREKYLHISQNAKLSYVVLIVKSCLYGVFVCFVIWKLQSSRGKQNK
uniref:Ig-like domain-containing protein n=1 Tax=Kryptolebias marmoratus TaxID=37003 RepID=A0A3Q3B0M8_KRYMA